MAETPLENALYRMKSYQALMAAEHGDKAQSTAADLKVLLDWIDHARGILGAVSPQPKGDFMDRYNKAERQRDTSYIARDQVRVSSATSDVDAVRLAAEQAEQHERPDERPADDFGKAAAATGEPPKAA